MTPKQTHPPFQLPTVPAGEMTEFVRSIMQLLAAVLEENALLREDNARLREEVALLRDEVAVLKGHKPRPKFKSSNLVKKTGKDDTPPSGPGAPACAFRTRRVPAAELPIHEDRIVRAQAVPAGAQFKGYRDFVVRELVIRAHNIRVRRELWLLADGTYLAAPRPPEYEGLHFGPKLRAFVLDQHHQCCVTQPALREQLHHIGIGLSAGQLDYLLTRDLPKFADEKAAVLVAGLKASPVVTVDDTGARHAGANGYATNVSGPAFAWFCSTASKSRTSFLELLHAGQVSYQLNDAAIRYMAEHGLPAAHVAQLQRGRRGGGPDLALLEKFLTLSGICALDHRRIAIEGALWGGLAGKVHPGLAVVSDGAGQFNVGSTHGMCWVHAERLIHRLIAGENADLAAAQERVRTQVWALFKGLKAYQAAPSAPQAQALSDEFDRVFTQKTCFRALNEQLARLHGHKDELLLVLRRPEVPLHTNQSETDIRDYVKKRKVSGGTRSERGRECRDTFASLKKTCRKLGVSFWDYLQDRLEAKGAIAPLPELIQRRMAQLS